MAQENASNRHVGFQEHSCCSTIPPRGFCDSNGTHPFHRGSYSTCLPPTNLYPFTDFDRFDEGCLAVKGLLVGVSSPHLFSFCGNSLEHFAGNVSQFPLFFSFFFTFHTTKKTLIGISLIGAGSFKIDTYSVFPPPRAEKIRTGTFKML